MMNIIVRLYCYNRVLYNGGSSVWLVRKFNWFACFLGMVLQKNISNKSFTGPLVDSKIVQHIWSKYFVWPFYLFCYSYWFLNNTLHLSVFDINICGCYKDFITKQQDSRRWFAFYYMQISLTALLIPCHIL
jgi:hypothetical protein